MSGTKTTDASLKEEAQLQQLTSLDMGGILSEITGAGLKEVVKLEQLSELYLSTPRITDAGLKDIAKLQKLTLLYLRFCRQITSAAVNELKKALPNCEIYTD